MPLQLLCTMRLISFTVKLSVVQGAAEEQAKSAKKTKGDLEFENQLAMAMMASVGSADQIIKQVSDQQMDHESGDTAKLKRRRHGGRGVAITSFQQAGGASYPDQVIICSSLTRLRSHKFLTTALHLPPKAVHRLLGLYKDFWSLRLLFDVQMADTWAEVYCGGEDGGHGQWVHVHPLYAWINRYCHPWHSQSA